MTPLAMEIVKDLTRPLKDRSKYDNAGILKKMDDIHCFEISAIVQEALIVGKEAFINGLTEQQTFLPADKVWIEWKSPKNHVGLLVCKIETEPFARFYMVSRLESGGWCSYADSIVISLQGTLINNAERLTGNESEFGKQARMKAGLEYGFLEAQSAKIIYGALAFINSPKIIGRRQHMPHRGLERELIKQQKIIGKFPLHAWTEIILDVTPPKEAEGQHDFEAHLTGRRALHFCRAHLRIRDGKLQFVKAHWRGDASIGIKRSRYIVKGAA